MCAADRRPAIHHSSASMPFGFSFVPIRRADYSEPPRAECCSLTHHTVILRGGEGSTGNAGAGYKRAFLLTNKNPSSDQAPKLRSVRQGLFGAARLTLRTVRRHDRRRFALAFLRLLCRLRVERGFSPRTHPINKKPSRGWVLCLFGGEPGIRTLGTLAGTTDFESVPFDHSGNSPSRRA